MSVEFYRWVQQRLTAHGFETKADGLVGAGTRAALETFQRARALRVTATATAETVDALRRDPETGVDLGPVKPPVQVRPVWLVELERRMGLHEVRDRSALMAWLRSDGRTLGDPAKLPWCGDAIQTAIALTLPNEPQLANPYLARNWAKFGRQCQPRLGAIMSFIRGARTGTAGHVALYLGESREFYQVAGGNQRNEISIVSIAKSRLLASRWPLTDSTQTFAISRAVNDPISTNEA